LRVFIHNHLEYFLAEQPAMKVCSHEAGVLTDARRAQVSALKREYYRIAASLVDDLKRERRLTCDTRIAVLSLFGMVNWIYTWHNPRTDADASHLAQQMSDIFLGGISSARKGIRLVTGERPAARPNSKNKH